MEYADEIMSEIITPDMTVRDKIKTFHDYVINTTKYDAQYVEESVDKGWL